MPSCREHACKPGVVVALDSEAAAHAEVVDNLRIQVPDAREARRRHCGGCGPRQRLRIGPGGAEGQEGRERRGHRGGGAVRGAGAGCQRGALGVRLPLVSGIESRHYGSHEFLRVCGARGRERLRAHCMTKKWAAVGGSAHAEPLCHFSLQ